MTSIFKVDSGREIANVLGAISQTLFPIARVSLQQQNRALASRFLNAARTKLAVSGQPISTPVPEIAQQPSDSTPPSVSLEPWMQKALSGDSRGDEAGQLVATDSLIAWHSSSVGFTDKSENQDATFACTDGNRLIFALADGITTSLGSREGAAVSAESVCRSLQAQLNGTTLPNPDMFRAAFQDAHRRVRRLAQALLALPLDGNLRRIGQDLQESSIRRLLELGLDRRPNSPVLASTLIAGVLTPNGKAVRVDLMRVGDGVVEKIDKLHRCSNLITMEDRSESALNAYLGPDQHSLESPQQFRTDELMVGEWLLVSSDGLVRAHEQSIWDMLAHLLNTSPERFLRPNESAGARKLLDAVGAVRKTGSFPRGFIEDNWSLVLARMLKTED
jgi:Protein phosphatase 2C